MNTSFKYKVYLPVRKEYIYFEQLTHDNFTTIAKVIANNDDLLLNNMFERIVNDLSGKKIKCNEITKIDMFCVLLNVFIMCVKSSIEMNIGVKEGAKQKIRLELYDMLDKVTNFDFEYKQQIKINDDLSVVLKPPTALLIPDADDVVVECIDTLTIFNEEYMIKDLTIKQKHEIFEGLPSGTINKIFSKMQEIDEIYKLDVLKYGPEPEEKITISLYNTSMFEVLKLIYRQNLQAQYFYTYFLSKHLGVTDPGSMTPAEVQIYLDLHKQEHKEQEKQRKAQEKKSKTGQHLGTDIPTGGI